MWDAMFAEADHHIEAGLSYPLHLKSTFTQHKASP
jgi:hypothetical protein